MSLFCQASNLGLPPVTSFNKTLTNIGTQTWAIAEDDFGYTWFANNKGLVKFDGYDWEVFRLPNDTKARSVDVDQKTHTVYVGGQGNFGYLKPDQVGNFSYVSLSDQLDSGKYEIGEVWNVIVSHHGVFFRTDNQVYRYDNGKVNVMMEEGVLLNFLGKWGDEIVLQRADKQLYIFKDGDFIPKESPNVFDHGRISAIINYTKDTILITTIDNAIFYETKSGFLPWKTSNDELLRSKIIYSATKSPNGKVLIGTSFSGLLIIDQNRRIESNINKLSGLQNNTVLSIMATRKGNIWLGLDNGIDLVNVNSSFRQIYPDGGLEGTGYSALLYEDVLYFGANTGLYFIPWKKYYNPAEKNEFQLIPGTKGQVWKIQNINGELWMGHHDGLFLIKDKKINRISNILGVWKLIESTKNTLIAGHYDGLSVMRNDGSSWTLDAHIAGFTESARIIENDVFNNIWISHPYRGIYFIKEQDIRNRKTVQKLFLPNLDHGVKLNNHIFKASNKILSTSGNALLELTENEVTDVSPNYLAGLTDLRDGLKFLLEDDYSNIWYGTNNEIGLLIPEKKFEQTYKKYIIKELSGKLTDGHESVLTIDKENVIFPTDKGFLLFNPASYINDTSSLELLLTKVTLKSKTDSVLLSGNLINKDRPASFALSNHNNNIQIHFSVKDYANKEVIEYSYLLKGSDKSWSAWSSSPNVVYNKLAPGNYSLSAKARNQNGTESNTIVIQISVAYPWYQTIWANLFYLLALGGIVYFMVSRLKSKHEDEKRNMENVSQLREKEHIQISEINKAEIIRLQNEKLQADINFKNQELTSFTYHLVNKNELITEIRKAIDRLEPKFEKDKDLKKSFKNIIQLTEQNTEIDNDWENFIKNFDQVHSDFFKRLNDEFSNLSPNDYKMCTYLRMNLASKEIAALMNISIRSVETNRYRLRKKLGLGATVNLTHYLLNY